MNSLQEKDKDVILGDEGKVQVHSLKDVVFFLCILFNQLRFLGTYFQTAFKIPTFKLQLKQNYKPLMAK